MKIWISRMTWINSRLNNWSTHPLATVDWYLSTRVETMKWSGCVNWSRFERDDHMLRHVQPGTSLWFQVMVDVYQLVTWSWNHDLVQLAPFKTFPPKSWSQLEIKPLIVSGFDVHFSVVEIFTLILLIARLSSARWGRGARAGVGTWSGLGFNFIWIFMVFLWHTYSGSPQPGRCHRGRELEDAAGPRKFPGPHCGFGSERWFHWI